MLLHLSQKSAEPLHAQMSRQIRAKILSGKLAEDDPLPSIRVMAKQQKISVLTVQRAYDDLEREGLIYTKRGKGFYICSLTTQQRKVLARDRLTGKIKPVIEDALATGLSLGGIIEVIRQIFKGRK